MIHAAPAFLTNLPNHLFGKLVKKTIFFLGEPIVGAEFYERDICPWRFFDWWLIVRWLLSEWFLRAPFDQGPCRASSTDSLIFETSFESKSNRLLTNFRVLPGYFVIYLKQVFVRHQNITYLIYFRRTKNKSVINLKKNSSFPGMIESYLSNSFSIYCVGHSCSENCFTVRSIPKSLENVIVVLKPALMH